MSFGRAFVQVMGYSERAANSSGAAPTWCANTGDGPLTTGKGWPDVQYGLTSLVACQQVRLMGRDRDRAWQKAYNSAYYEANRERIRSQQNAYSRSNRSKIVARRKGMTVAQVQDLLAQQDARCAICRVDLDTPHIDHDHTCCPGSDACGRCTRGLLCPSCNHMLGKAYDKPEVLEAAAAYLRRYGGAQ